MLLNENKIFLVDLVPKIMIFFLFCFDCFLFVCPSSFIYVTLFLNVTFCVLIIDSPLLILTRLLFSPVMDLGHMH